eukprot:6234136-Pyramimonas_sp.AAC.1
MVPILLVERKAYLIRLWLLRATMDSSAASQEAARKEVDVPRGPRGYTITQYENTFPLPLMASGRWPRTLRVLFFFTQDAREIPGNDSR